MPTLLFTQMLSTDAVPSLLLISLPSPHPPNPHMLSKQFSSAAVTAVSGPSGMGETWGNPMATSTPAPGYYGNSGGGFGGSGMTQTQQIVSDWVRG